jgi:Protein of unknown function (DUF2612)
MTGNNTEKLVATLATPFQSLENALRQLLLERSIDTAVGAQLDVIGKIVGQYRNGLNDDDYRRYCRARITVNKATGVIEELITVTDLIVYDDDATYEIINNSVATVVIKINDIVVTEALADIVISFLRDTVSAGVRVILEYNNVPIGTGFKWDTPGRGWDSGAPFLDAKD